MPKISQGDGYNFEYDDGTLESKNKKVLTPFDENAYEDVENSPDAIKSINFFSNTMK